MKLFDEKGRIFGLINVIDIVVVLMVLLLGGFLGAKLMGGKLGEIAGVGGGNTKEVIVTVRCTARSDSAVAHLKEGDQLVSLTTKVNAYIVSAYAEDAEASAPNSQGQLIKTRDPAKKDIVVKFRMKADFDAPIIKLGTQDVAVGGRAFEVITNRVHLTGAVESIVPTEE